MGGPTAPAASALAMMVVIDVLFASQTMAQRKAYDLFAIVDRARRSMLLPAGRLFLQHAGPGAPWP